MRFLIISLLLVLTGCEGGLQSSDYVGGYVTSNGNCAKKGQLGLDFDKKTSLIDLNFYCFLKSCSNISGKTSGKGYFYIEDDDGYYIQGKITPLEAQGSWFMRVQGNDCYGSWVALKN